MKFKIGSLVFLSQEKAEQAYKRRYLAVPAVGEYFRPVHKNEHGVWVASPEYSFLVTFGEIGLVIDYRNEVSQIVTKHGKYILLFGERICMHPYDIVEELFEEFTASTAPEALQEREPSTL